MTSTKIGLHLSQSSLQDFHDCPRRFQLKVIDKIPWPAPYLEPLSQLEKATNLGNSFHRLCQQYFSGIDSISILKNISDPDLKLLFDNFIPFADQLQSEELFSEIILGTPFSGHQLVAKFDLVLKTDDGNYEIYDWKTAAKKPSRTHLSQRYQTFLYPYIMAKAGKGLFKSGQLSPEMISMTYFYPLSSDPEEIFPYSNSMYSEHTDKLTRVISEIDGMVDSGKPFPLTENIDQCQRCVYRSLCERGTQAGNLDLYTEIDQEDLSAEHFDLDNIIEIEF